MIHDTLPIYTCMFTVEDRVCHKQLGLYIYISISKFNFKLKGEIVNKEAGKSEIVNKEAGKGEIVNKEAGKGEIVNKEAGKSEIVNKDADKSEIVNKEAGRGNFHFDLSLLTLHLFFVYINHSSRVVQNY